MNVYSKYTDGELMNEIKAGDMLAFDALYNKYCQRLYNFSISILKNSEDAENIVQDVFLNLWVNRDKVEKCSSVKYYIFTIAYNSSITVIRKKLKDSRYKEYVKTQQACFQEPCDIQLEYSEIENILEDIIHSLPDRQKEVYLLSRTEGMKYKEIADKLNISINTVENHISRALKKIQVTLGNYSLFALLFWFLFI